MVEAGWEAPSISLPGWPPTRFTGAHSPPTIGSPVCSIRPSVGSVPLSLPPSLGAIGGIGLQGLVRWITGLGGGFRRSDGMFGNGQSFGDREVTWEWVYPSSRVSPLRFLARRFP